MDGGGSRRPGGGHGSPGLSLLHQRGFGNGRIINIDGVGNRLAGTLYGHEEVWFLVGENKIVPDEASALHRARSVAAPLNNRRIGKRTPCTARCDQCYDCQSPDRGCAALMILWRKPAGIQRAHVVLIEEELGY